MPTDAAFRLSTYLTLAFACAALGYAEYELLPEVAFIAGAVFISLIVLYRLETRVELLSIPAANRLGLVLGLGNLVWATFRILREFNNPELINTNWALLGLAMVGPLVMTLMPAKLARRERHAGDYWWLHGLALATAALAGAMADDFLIFTLISLYSICAIWSISLFYLRRTAGWVLPVPGQPTRALAVGVIAPQQRRWGIARSLAVAALAVAVAAPMYLLTPRSTFQPLDFGKSRVEIGYAADQMIDLTKTGDLKANQEIAFDFTAANPDGSPYTDVSLDQRWRGRIMRRYYNGVWQPGEFRLPSIEPVPQMGGVWTPPQLGPGQFTITFTLPQGARGRFLADPVVWAAQQPSPIATLTSSGPRPWVWGGDGSFLSDIRMSPAVQPLQYIQVWRPGIDPDLSPPFQLTDIDPRAILHPIRQNTVPKIKEYADELIAQMVRQKKLPVDHLDRIDFLPRPEFHEMIAREFSKHLATTPELTYTTELRREKKEIDPIEEFLFHTHAGHCERFATALALMLRSQGIPAILVLGFKGCETTDEPGKYLVRQEHAHAWVEALIEQIGPGPAQRGDRPVCRWLSLDPTPAGGPATDNTDSGWVSRAGTWIRRIIDKYISGYTAEERQRAIAAMLAWTTKGQVLGTIAAIAALLVLMRFFIRRGRLPLDSTSAEARWLNRLLALLASHGYKSGAGETPREFAMRVAETLRQNPHTFSVAEVPLDWVDSYYQTRFGGHPLSPDRLTSLDTRLDDLKRALAAR